jgi:hypothetical protein
VADWFKRKVSVSGKVSVDGDEVFISTALQGYTVALEPCRGLRHRVWFYGMQLGEVEVASVRAEQVHRLAG